MWHLSAFIAELQKSPPLSTTLLRCRCQVSSTRFIPGACRPEGNSTRPRSLVASRSACVCFCHGMVLQHVVTPHPSSSWLSSPKMNASPCTRSGKRPRMSAFWNAYFQIGATCVGCACVLFRETINTQLRCAYRKGWNKDIGWRRCNVQRLPRGPATSLGQECCQHDGNRWVPQFHIELMWTKLFSSRSHGLHIFSSIEAGITRKGLNLSPSPSPKTLRRTRSSRRICRKTSKSSFLRTPLQLQMSTNSVNELKRFSPDFLQAE